MGDLKNEIKNMSVSKLPNNEDRYTWFRKITEATREIPDNSLDAVFIEKIIYILVF